MVLSKLGFKNIAKKPHTFSTDHTITNQHFFASLRLVRHFKFLHFILIFTFLIDFDLCFTEMNDTSCSLPLSRNQPSFDSSDEISIFLHHLLHSSSSSPSPHLISKPSPLQPPSPPPPPSQQPPSNLVFSDEHHHHNRGGGEVNRVLDSAASRVRDGMSASANDSSSGIFFPSQAPISSSLGDALVGDCDAVTVSVKRQRRFTSENDLDDFDCESEEGFEGSDGPSKLVQPRGSSKRSRAAEVHNLSEKRRRSRINEKMKALQNLIPNSNKTDKASMLDEAIEYLKQLQVQVQMLSMRNGFSLHPMYLPAVVQPLQLPQVRLGFNEGNGLHHHVNIGRDTLPVNQEASARTSFGLPNQCTTSNQGLVIPAMPDIPTSETSYGLDSSVQVNQESFQLPAVSQEIYREQMFAQHKLYSGQSSRNLSENKLKAIAGASLPFDAQPSSTEHSGSLEAQELHGDRSQNMLATDVDNDHILVQHMHRQE